jgi:hypothetical protein
MAPPGEEANAFWGVASPPTPETAERGSERQHGRPVLAGPECTGGHQRRRGENADPILTSRGGMVIRKAARRGARFGSMPVIWIVDGPWLRTASRSHSVVGIR